MKTTIQRVYMLMNDVKKLAKLNVIKPVSEANGNLIQIYDRDYELRIAKFEEDHDSAISTLGVGVQPNWTDAQCKQVFPRVDICTMEGDYIDFICMYAKDKWIRYKAPTASFLNLFVNRTIDKMISEFSAANILNASLLTLQHIGIC